MARFPRSSSSLTLTLVATLLAACGSASVTTSQNGGSSTGASSQGGDGGTGGGTGGSLFGAGGVGGDFPMEGLNIAPQNPTLDVEYGVPGATVQFTATDANGNPVNPAWVINTPEAGTIDQSGVFTANGVAAGEVVVSAKLGDDTATTTLTINMHALENPAGLSADDQAILTGGGGVADGAWNIWYPYEATVFPRGIPVPEVQFATGSQSATAYYLHVVTPSFEYEGFLPQLAGPSIQMSQGIWDALGTASDGGLMTMEISKLVNGQKVGPITRTFRVAKGKLRGTIYYNTYDSPLAGYTGAIMRIQGNSTAPQVFIGNCTVCHSVAADGSSGAAANHSGPGGVFDFTANGANLVWQDAERAAFSALYPKGGEVVVIQGAPGNQLGDDWGWGPNTPGTSGSWFSELRTKAGTVIPGSGIESYFAQTPVFSHDGTRLAFYDRPGSGGQGTLAIMDYDPLTQKFSNHQVLSVPQPGMHDSWPAFTPDGKFVIFQQGTGTSLATWNVNQGKLYMVGVDTHVETALTIANGDGYMPQGARDEFLNYEPTVLPLAAGGYYWVMFTSRRTFGNKLLGTRDQTKRLWVSAFDVNAQDGVDPSHPAFYITGQELSSGNSRGFWALDPCKSDGEGCESGDQCCNGFCNPSEEDPTVFVCGQPDGECSEELEACTTAADCCDPSFLCINGKCSQPPPN
jgi:hypothetical protein